MTYTMKLRYGEFLLRLIKIAGYRSDWARILPLCDRFERVMASIPATPLMWEGDNA